MMVADTDVLIDALHGRDPARARIQLELGTGRLATTAVTVFELLSGARGERSRQRIETLLEALTVLPLDPEASRRAAEIRTALEASGQGIGMADYLIAGICVSRDHMLITRNLKHFGRVPGISLATLAS